MLNLPTKIDWNNLNGKKWTTEFRSQGSANRTCLAFGSLAVLEALLKIHYYNNPDQSLDLSECSLWTCGHRWAAKGYPDGDCSNWNDATEVDKDATWTIEPPLRYLKKFGVASEIDNKWPTTCVCAAPSPNTKIKSFQMISITGTGNADDLIEELKKKLVMYGPLIVEYSLPAPETGTHCVAIVGYDANGFLIKDSLNKDHTSLPYNTAFNGIRFIEVYKPRLNINIDGAGGANALSLKMVKTKSTIPGSTYLGNLAEVDPTVLPNLQSSYNASYDGDSGWLSISPGVAGTPTLPLHLAVPPGSYDIFVAISSHIYGSVVIGMDVSDIPVEITLQEQPAPQQLPAPQHPSLSFDAGSNMIAASWNAALECASYRLVLAHIRVQDYQDNSLLIEKHDLAITCENGIISSNISISEILPQYAGKLCKVEVRYDNLGQLSDWSEPVGIALAIPFAKIEQLEIGINSIFMRIYFGAASNVEAQIFDGANQIILDPGDIENHFFALLGYPAMGYYEGDWRIDPEIMTFHPGVRNGGAILKISIRASILTVGKIYNVKVRAKDDHFIGPFAEQQITWQPASYDPTWPSDYI